MSSDINMDIRAVSFQLNLLSPQSRVLAMCTEKVRVRDLSQTMHFSRPTQTLWHAERAARPHVRLSGLRPSKQHGMRVSCSSPRRKMVPHAIYWISWNKVFGRLSGLSKSVLNIFTADFCSSWRPWASAYMTHVRALAPILRNKNFSHPEAGHWAGFFVRVVELIV